MNPNTNDVRLDQVYNFDPDVLMKKENFREWRDTDGKVFRERCTHQINIQGSKGLVNVDSVNKALFGHGCWQGAYDAGNVKEQFVHVYKVLGELNTRLNLHENQFT